VGESGIFFHLLKLKTVKNVPEITG
jgi:hypothetical protein